jgi:uncharacterized protein with HEPN domain
MSSRPRKWKFRLRHIIEAAERIRGYVAGMTYAEFVGDQRTVDAVLHNFIVIGEATRHVPEPVKTRYGDVPWGEMWAMRNVVAHGYDRVNLQVVWKTVQEDLPPLAPLLQAVLEAEGPDEG